MLPLSAPSLRPFKALFTATAVTLALLLFMAKLISTDIPPAAEAPICCFGIYQPNTVIDDNPKDYSRTKPKFEPLTIPSPTVAIADPATASFESINFDKSLFSRHSSVATDGLKAMGKSIMAGGGDRSASLSNPIAARYPPEAIERGAEGYVDVIFDITPTGTTTNVRVLAAEPKRIFNRSAVKAVKRWKYRPQIEGGVAVAVTEVVARVHFELEN